MFKTNSPIVLSREIAVLLSDTPSVKLQFDGREIEATVWLNDQNEVSVSSDETSLSDFFDVLDGKKCYYIEQKTLDSFRMKRYSVR